MNWTFNGPETDEEPLPTGRRLFSFSGAIAGAVRIGGSTRRGDASDRRLCSHGPNGPGGGIAHNLALRVCRPGENRDRSGRSHGQMVPPWEPGGRWRPERSSPSERSGLRPPKVATRRPPGSRPPAPLPRPARPAARTLHALLPAPCTPWPCTHTTLQGFIMTSTLFPTPHPPHRPAWPAGREPCGVLHAHSACGSYAAGAAGAAAAGPVAPGDDHDARPETLCVGESR